MTDPLIARLDALAQEATPGEWYRDASSYRSLCAREDGVLVMGDGGRAIWSNDDDPAFIAALVTAWPVLRARLEAGERAVTALADLKHYGHLNAHFTEEARHIISAHDAATTKDTP